MLFFEPLYGSYDIRKDTASKTIGYEHSYTHNYVYLLENAGIQVLRNEERQVMGYRMLILLAHNKK